jgi:hypothetical protein
MCDVDPKGPWMARNAHAKAGTDIDLRAVSCRGLKGVPGSRHIGEQCHAHVGQPPREHRPLQLHRAVRESPAKDATVDDASSEQRVRPRERVPRMPDVGARPEAERRASACRLDTRTTHEERLTPGRRCR